MGEMLGSSPRWRRFLAPAPSDEALRTGSTSHELMGVVRSSLEDVTAACCDSGQIDSIISLLAVSGNGNIYRAGEVLGDAGLSQHDIIGV